jgi:Immunity protein 50
MDETPSPESIALPIPGARSLIEWFGYWPSFHDAEVTSIELTRSGASRIAVHAFEPTGEVNAKGQYVLQKHVIVSFVLNGVREVELTGFNHQNVLSGLELERSEQGYQLTLEGCYGVEGSVSAESVRIELAEGAPPDSQYLTEGTP